MDAVQFAAVAASCRWSKKSLAIARHILVDGVSLPETAAKHAVTPKHARVLLARFKEKAERMAERMTERKRLEAFMQKEQPKLAVHPLTSFLNDMQTLREKGYTFAQVVAYLKTNGVTTSETTVRNFLRSNG
ncbi:hypothetical protein [Mesorhizobium sp. J428]|uniref:hypothetical protein n=1 Tax=Mesorhizobium sp. J428 TaxID=2898440 RepID=UPI0021511E45|nr:hypothetical protein [Mesorhizobium sp. J428]MCR5860127.1 hypothetical protein [Mesorhizobium sp. J428]MCR5860157.1 hypothetical protein [Mesorhizobium sp. J428]MCR5860191.1 hypothetical protein [Mesorhizobium sp. J428]MCR5860220.1 hypothetical protein [Mesorhizobium sp. J428]